ncbi:MAG: amidophosphoribosyltransferase [Thermoplasmata archaeon]|nr:amidophosphoribosyltransferase [Thermoplasmata archaeon]
MPLHERCGVAATACKEEIASYILYRCLRALQHRGQEASGISVFKGKILSVKGIGVVDNVFDDGKLHNLASYVGIGHDYYSIKISVPDNAQPHVVSTPSGEIAVAHNGIITNSDILKEKLKARGHCFQKESEEESIAFILSDEYMKHRNIIRSFKTLVKVLNGSYALTILWDSRVFALRDPLGLRPLCVGCGNGYTIAASESVALDVNDAVLTREVEPGELIELKPSGFESYRIGTSGKRAFCFFEYTYFARADSIMNGRSVYEIRRRIGWRLAKEKPVDADVVVPVPDSGRAHAFGYSRASGIHYNEGLIKNRYIARTFILPKQEKREMNVREKLNPIRDIVEGRRVVLVDDSIVRGTTMRSIIEILRHAGASEVHVRVGSPPIISPCFYGIDMTTKEQFVATDRTEEEIAEKIGADSVGYISIDGLVEAVQHEKRDLCLGCVTGIYPTTVETAKAHVQPCIWDFNERD